MPSARPTDRADLQERRKIIARCQQRPDRQHRGDEAVSDQHHRELLAGVIEHRPEHGIGSNVAAVNDRQHQQHKPDQRHLADAARAKVAPVNAHQHRDRDGHHDGERGPRTLFQSFDDDERQHREQDHHDQQHADHRNSACEFAKLGADHVAERTAVAARRGPQHDEVLHGTGKHDANNQPQRSGQISHLRRQHRPDQWAGARDRCKVMAKENGFIGRAIVEPVVEPAGGRQPVRIEAQHALSDEEAVEPEGEQIAADRCGDEPDGVDCFTTRQRQDAERNGSQYGDAQPTQIGAYICHDFHPLAVRSCASRIDRAGDYIKNGKLQKCRDRQMSCRRIAAIDRVACERPLRWGFKASARPLPESAIGFSRQTEPPVFAGHLSPGDVCSLGNHNPRQ